MIKNRMKHRWLSVLVVMMMLANTLIFNMDIKDVRADEDGGITETIEETAFENGINNVDQAGLNMGYEETDDLLKDETVKDPAEGTKLLNYVDYEQFYSEKHVRRLEKDEQLNTYVFKNSDGTDTIYILDENVKYMDENGNAVEKDLGLIKKGTLYTTISNDVYVSFPEKINEGIELRYLDNSILLKPVTDGKDAFAIKSEDFVEYSDIFGEGISLRYTPTIDGFKEDIIMDSPSDIKEFKFILNTDSMKIMSDEAGYYLVKDDNKEKIRLGNVYMHDSNYMPGLGELKIELKKDREYIITVIPDKDYFDDPNIKYPVIIDPTITISDNTHGENAIVDAPIFSGIPTQNFGSYLFDRVGNTGNGHGVGRTVVRLAGLLSNNTYIHATVPMITSVKFCVMEGIGATNQSICLYPLTTNTTWTETGVTWNNVGNYNSYSNFGNTMNDGELTKFNITNLVQCWKTGTFNGNAGFIMRNLVESSNEAFRSCEYPTTTSRPYIMFSYDKHLTPTESEVSLNIGENHTLMVNACIPDNYTVKWSSGNERIAIVDENTGLVFARQPGRISIKAYCPEEPVIETTISLTVLPTNAPTSGIVSGNVYMIRNNVTGRYLKADSGNSLSVAAGNPLDGKQLWYVVLSSSGYRLYSMGIKDLIGHGAKEMKLVGNTIDQSPKVVVQTSSHGNWSISKDGNYYYLTNRSTAYNNTSISDDWSFNVFSKSLDSETGHARWIFEKIEKSEFENYWLGGYLNSGTRKNLKIVLDTDGMDSVFANNIFQNSDFDCLNIWEQYSSKINICYGDDDPVPEGENYINVHIVGNPSTTIDYYGITYGHDVNNSINYPADWKYVYIYINTNTSTLNGGLTLKDKPAYLREYVLLHELGHALKLAHPYDGTYCPNSDGARNPYSGWNSVAAVMNQKNPASTNNLTCCLPKYHDIINLRNKWGN